MQYSLTPEQKEKIITILTHSFDQNKSTNFVVKQDNKRGKRLRFLIEYSLFNAEKSGFVLLNDTEDTCCLILDSEKKKPFFQALIWDVKLVVKCIGIGRVFKVLKREGAIKKQHPSKPFYHLWYIGVNPELQGHGLGSKMLQKAIQQAKSNNKAIYLETSNPRNFRFYEKHGFEHYFTLKELGYELRFFRINEN